MTPVLALMRRLLLQFLLPVLAAGPVMFGAEKGVQALGFQVDDTQFVRMLALAFYGLIVLVMASRRKPAPPEGDPHGQNRGSA